MRFFKHFFDFGKRAYLDVASSTPIDKKMQRAIPTIPQRILAANPSALHQEGVQLKRFLTDARARIAKVLDVHSDEIIFTSGATESDNLAIIGTLKHWITAGIQPQDIIVFSTELEHSSVSETIAPFVEQGVQHNIFPIGEGIVDPKHIIIPGNAKAVFLTVMYVSNEIGTVQPIAEIAKRVRKLRKMNPELEVVFHTDATQAPAHLSLRIPNLGVDLLTLGATKLYCNKGVGVLYKKRSLTLVPLLYGGGQEQGLRPGTQPVALIHEFSYALHYANEHREAMTAQTKELQDYFETTLKKQFPHAQITGAHLPRTPHISHVAIPNFDSELMVLELDARGIAVSAKSACKNEDGAESPIVEKLYGKGWGAVRFSFGRKTTKRDLDKAIRALGTVFKKYK